MTNPSPLAATATHNAVEGQEIASKSPPISTGALHVGVAAVGSVVMNPYPFCSTATHNAVEEQETALRPPPLSIFVGALHVGVAAVGSVEITTFPPRSTATQNVVVVAEHETLVSWLSKALSILAGAPQVGVEAVGSVVIIALPENVPAPLSTATHSEFDAHDTLVRSFGLSNGAWWSTSTGAAHDSPDAPAGPAPSPDIASEAHRHANAGIARHDNALAIIAIPTPFALNPAPK